MLRLKSFFASVGACPRCFRLSLQVAVLLWITAIVFYVASIGPWFWQVAGVTALLATLLWLTHLSIFTARATTKLVKARPEEAFAARRTALRAIASGVAYGAGLGVVLSIVPASKVRADDVPGCLQDALCDAQHPCSGCKCNYPPKATVGYCR